MKPHICIICWDPLPKYAKKYCKPHAKQAQANHVRRWTLRHRAYRREVSKRWDKNNPNYKREYMKVYWPTYYRRKKFSNAIQFLASASAGSTV